jgi:hypothetical protein
MFESLTMGRDIHYFAYGTLQKRLSNHYQRRRAVQQVASRIGAARLERDNDGVRVDGTKATRRLAENIRHVGTTSSSVCRKPMR